MKFAMSDPWRLRHLLWAAPLILMAPVYAAGRAIFWGTPLLQFIPWWAAAAQMLAAGRLPLWNPLVGMGAPLLANYQSALLYPPTWSTLLAYALGGVGGMAWWSGVLLALHLAWAAWGMARLAERVGVNPLAQIVAGLAYGLSGYLTARAGFLSINAATAWLPWVLCYAGAPIGLSADSRPNFLKLTGSLAMLLLAGHAQTAWYGVLLAGVWSAFWAWRRAGRRSSLAALTGAWGGLALAGLLAAALAAAQLLPTAELLRQSQRAAAVDYDFAMSYSFWPWRLITLLAPGFFGSPVQGDYWGYGNYWEDALYLGVLPLLLAFSTLKGLFPRRAGSQPALGGQIAAERSPAHAARIAAERGAGGQSAVGARSAAGEAQAAMAPGTADGRMADEARFAVGRSLVRGPASAEAARGGGPPPALTALLWGVFAVALLLGLGDHTPVFPWLYRRIPTFALFQAPTRWLIWGQIALALLAGIGVHAWRRPVGRGLYWTRLGVMGGVAVMLGAGLAWAALGQVSPSFLRATALMGLWGVGAGLLSLIAPVGPDALFALNAAPPQPKFRLRALQGVENRLGSAFASLSRRFASGEKGGSAVARWQAAVAVWTALDLLVAAWGLNPGAPLSLYTQPAANAAALRSLSEGHRLYMPPGDEHQFKYVRFLRFRTFDPGEDWSNLRLAQLADVNLLDGLPLVNNFDPMLPGRYAAWLELLADQPAARRYDWLQRADVGLQIEVYRRAPDGLRLRPLPAPAGRLWWAGCAQAAPDAAAARQAIQARAPDGPLVLETIDPLPPCAPAGPAAIASENAAYDLRRPDQVSAQVNAEAGGWLVLSDAWYPGWVARIDGAPAQLLPADLVFKAVWVDAGSHTVEFLYRPLSFYLGGGVSLAALLLLGRLIWKLRR